MPGCNYQSPISPDGAVYMIATAQSVPRCSVGNTRSHASPFAKVSAAKVSHSNIKYVLDVFFFFVTHWLEFYVVKM